MRSRRPSGFREWATGGAVLPAQLPSPGRQRSPPAQPAGQARQPCAPVQPPQLTPLALGLPSLSPPYSKTK